MRDRGIFVFIDSDLDSQRGFTLIEIAIGMLILGLFVAGAAQAFYLFLVHKASEDMDVTVGTVQSALLEFTVDDPNDPNDNADSRYPCPAPLGAAPGTANFGREVCPGDLANPGPFGTDLGEGVFVVQGAGGEAVLVGTVPTSTMQISSRHMFDPYHNRMLYAVSLSHVMPGALNNPAMQPPDAVEIIDPSNNIQAADFVLLSHGKDGAGSYTSEGVPNGAGCRTTTAGDAQNCSWQSDNRALFRDQFGHSLAVNDQYYDDRAIFSLTTGNDNGWWVATDGTGQDITHLNPGNIGIGTNAPTAKLDVTGDTNVTGNTTVTGNATITGNETVNGNSIVTGSTNIGSVDVPRSMLDVRGEIQIGATGAPCDGNRIGAIRFNAGQVEYCDASNWGPIADIPPALTASCSGGKVLTGVKNGKPVCTPVRQSNVNNRRCNAGEVVTGFNNAGAPICGPIASLLPSCAEGEVLVKDANGNFICGSGIQESEYAQAYRKDGPPSNRPIIVMQGPASAFLPVNNQRPHRSSKYYDEFKALDGIQCNKKKGWRVINCHSVVRGDDADLFPYENGCVTNDYDHEQDTEVSIQCIRVFTTP